MIASRRKSSTDLIVSWACERGFTVCYDRAAVDRLTVRMRHSVVQFDDGEVRKIKYHNQGPGSEEMIRELAVLFALCGYLAIIRESESPMANGASSLDAAMLDRLHRDMRIRSRRTGFVERNAR